MYLTGSHNKLTEINIFRLRKFSTCCVGQMTELTPGFINAVHTAHFRISTEVLLRPCLVEAWLLHLS